MSRSAYLEIAQDCQKNARSQEREAFDYVIGLLKQAAKEGVKSRASFDALLATRRLWTFLIEELGKSTNALPQSLRAELISIGLWVLRACEQINQGEGTNYQAIIDVCSTIRDGL